MNSEFENQLRRQPMREVPPHWRARIMAATQSQPTGWREWFWPCPKAWGVLGAAWVVILALNVSAGKRDGPAAQSIPSFSREALLEFRQQQEILAKLISPMDLPDAEPPKPRSELRMAWRIV